MDMYEDSFKLQEMIDSDMRTQIDELMPNEMFSDNVQRAHSPTLTSLAPATLSEPMDSMDNIPLDSDLGNGIGIAWVNGTPMYGFNMDFEALGGLLVNPQTGLPISLSMPTALSPVITSSAGSVTLNEANVTLNSQVMMGQQQQNVSMQFADVEPADNLSYQMRVTPSPGNQGVVPVYLVQNVVDNEQRQQQNNQRNATPGQKVNTPKLETNIQQQRQQLAEPKKRNSSKNNMNNKQPLDVVTSLNENEKKFPKPAYSYSCLIAMALKNSRSGSLPVNEIYNFMTEHFPYFKTAPAGWKNSVRHNLSLNKCFEKVDKPAPVNTSGAARKGCLWAMNPAKISKMEDELRKWRSKNGGEIKRSMANPEKLDMLEKGEMKPFSDDPLDDDEADSDDAQQPVVSSTEEIDSKIGIIKTEPVSIVDSSSMNSPEDNQLPSLENSIQLDDLELQKGLWDDLDDERLQFLGDTLSNSSLLNTPMGDSPASTPTSNPVSFVHCNYVYSPVAMSNDTVSSSTVMLNNQDSVITSTGNAR